MYAEGQCCAIFLWHCQVVCTTKLIQNLNNLPNLYILLRFFCIYCHAIGGFNEKEYWIYKIRSSLIIIHYGISISLVSRVKFKKSCKIHRFLFLATWRETNSLCILYESLISTLKEAPFVIFHNVAVLAAKKLPYLHPVLILQLVK